MPDLCMYELEDIAWDDLCLSADHTFPRPGSEISDGNSGVVNSQKKSPCLATSHHIKDNYAVGYGEFASLSWKRSKMLEKNSWAQTSDDMFFSSPDREVEREASNAALKDVSSGHVSKSNHMDSIGNDFCMLVDKTTTVGKNCFSYPLPDATHKENNIDFFEKGGNRDSGDLSYYDWPEIGNFEDVDRMLRSCDSTFGLGGSNGDGLGWFSSADDDGEFKDEMKSHMRFTLSENDGSKSITVNDSAKTNSPNVQRDDLWISNESESYISFADAAAMTYEDGGFNSQGQIIDERTQSSLQKQSGGKRKEHQLINGSSSYLSNLSNEATQGATSHLDFSSGVMQQQHALSPGSYGLTQNHFTYTYSGSNCFSVLRITDQSPSAFNLEVNNGLASLSPSDDLSGVSRNLHYMESFSETFPEGFAEREKLQNHHNSQSSINGSPMDTSNGASLSDLAKQAQSKLENYSGVEGVFQVIPAELCSSMVQQSPTGRSGTEDNSLEATSFRQLQLAMEQLDLKTKLRIRDSLYRLARSAEQRHNNHTNSNSPNRDEREGTGTQMAEGTNNFMDMETQTNPIDRSVAHLLFHRASLESSATPSCDLLPSELPSVVQSTSCPSAKEKNLIICEETASANRENG